MIVLLCTALSGGMFYLSQGIDNVWWLAWIAPVPLLWLAYGETGRWQVFAASAAAFAAGQIYMVQCYGTYLITSELLMMFGNGALFAGAILLARRVWRASPPAAALVAFPALWTAAEYGVGLFSPHGSFGSIAYSQVSFPAAIQIASLLGMYAITFMLCLFSNALALLARGARETAAGGVALCALALVYGAFQLAASQTAAVHAAALSDWNASQAAGHSVTHKGGLAAARAMAAQYAGWAWSEADKGARLIVIPEGALLVDPAWRDTALAPLADVARGRRVTIVAGTVMMQPWRNTAQAFLPGGSQRVYDKRHLLLPGEARFEPGNQPGLLGFGRAMAICKDLDFPRTLRADVRAAGAQQGIRVLAVPANDFGRDGWIHARMAILRGVENGFAIVRAASKGLETISDAQGRTIARADTNRPGLTAISAAVEPGPGATLYTAIGDVFAWVCIALSVTICVLATRTGFLPPRGEAAGGGRCHSEMSAQPARAATDGGN